MPYPENAVQDAWHAKEVPEEVVEPDLEIADPVSHMTATPPSLAFLWALALLILTLCIYNEAVICTCTVLYGADRPYYYVHT